VRQFLLATALVAAAVGAFFGGRVFLLPGRTEALGDMTAFSAIATDVQGIAEAGDLAAAATRITDLETAWDDADATLRPKNPEAWGVVDGATDDALHALRAGTPDAAEVAATLVALQAALADPSQGDTSPGEVVMIGAVAVTDANGHPLPCETMLTAVKDRQAAGTPTPEASTKVAEPVAKATERCNADDDKTSDSFSALALAALAG
jgi:hypothetical protein